MNDGMFNRKDIFTVLNHVHSVEKECVYNLELGSLHLWFQFIQDECRVAFKYEEKDEDLCAFNRLSDFPSQLKLKRYIAAKSFNQFSLNLVFPDKSIVVGSENPVSILPRKRALFFVSIPLFVKLAVQDNKIEEFSTLIRPKTWFGDPMSGELCYALKTHAKREFEEFPERPFRAICPIKIKNNSGEVLNFEKICLSPKHLMLFQGKIHFWGNQVEVNYEGEKIETSISYSQEIPKHESDLIKKCAPREVATESIFRRTFDHLKLWV